MAFDDFGLETFWDPGYYDPYLQYAPDYVAAPPDFSTYFGFDPLALPEIPYQTLPSTCGKPSSPRLGRSG